MIHLLPFRALPFADGAAYLLNELGDGCILRMFSPKLWIPEHSNLQVSAADAAGLIEGIGTPAFAEKLLDLAGRGAQIQHCAVFTLHRHMGVAIAAGASRTPRNIAVETGYLYAASFYSLDAGRKKAAAALDEGAQLVMHRQASHDVEHEAYRMACYTRLHIIERLGVLAPHSNGLMTINFYRDIRWGRFDPAEVDFLSALAFLVVEACRKHIEQSRDALFCDQRETNLMRLRELVGSLEQSLPQREQEVCAGILMGMATKVIARDLGVQPNTVVTYRKRAYERLGIRSQNELFLLCLEAVSGSRTHPAAS